MIAYLTYWHNWVFNIAYSGGKWSYTLQLLREAWERGDTTELHTGNHSPTDNSWIK